VRVAWKTRQLQFPARWARRFTANGPVICQSGAVLPSPVPFTGSLLLTAMMWQVGVGSQLSCTATPTVTGTSLWLGGHSTLGVACTVVIRGAVVSTTCTVMDVSSPEE